MTIQAQWNSERGVTACEVALPGGLLAVDIDAKPTEVASHPSPHDLLDAALAACTTLTLELYAQRKAYEIRQIDVKVTHTHEAGVYRMRRSIQVFGALTDDQRAALLRVAEACPVHKTLVGDIQIDTHLEADAL